MGNSGEVYLMGNGEWKCIELDSLAGETFLNIYVDLRFICADDELIIQNKDEPT